MPRKNLKYSRSIFLNCPFDTKYRPLLWAMLFTVIQCGLEPRIASESSDSGIVRIDKIKVLIKSCRYSIHDISRMEPVSANRLPRFNMPFELGLDLGCRQFGSNALRRKKCLVLEKKPYRYQKVLSDIAGCDIKAHADDGRKIVSQVRNWICENVSIDVVAPSLIWEQYNVFQSIYEDALKNEGYTRKEIKNIPIPQFISLARPWIQANHL